MYGLGASETVLGRILAGRRSRFVLATKVGGRMKPGDPSSGGLSGRHVRESCEASLKRLRTDYLDMYMPHMWDPYAPLEETLGALDRLRIAGKVGTYRDKVQIEPQDPKDIEVK